ncbi:acetylornithine deacetylase [Thalassotalea fusca]
MLPNFEAALSALIATPSMSSTDAKWDQGNLPVIQLLATWFEQLGFTISIEQVPHSKNKYNLLAKLGSGEGGLLLSGHSDTVPYDENRWQSDPFKLKDADNRFYGLGTCDMKGFFAFILQACKHLDLKKMHKPLYVLATADEETTMAGARFFAKQQLIRPDAAIIGEPTSLVPVVMHKGHMSHRIAIVGQSGHSSQPDKGINAIELMHQVVTDLLKLKSQLSKQYQHEAFEVPYPTLNLGAIRGGDNANRICGYCQLDIDLRAIPGQSDEELTALLLQALAPIKQQFPERITVTELHPSSPSFSQDASSQLVAFSEKETTNKCCAVNYATEAPYIQSLGCQTIVLGPGSISQAHQPNEFLLHSEITQTERFLMHAIKQYCLT